MSDVVYRKCLKLVNAIQDSQQNRLVKSAHHTVCSSRVDPVRLGQVVQ